MRFSIAALATLPFIGLCGGSALAADPRPHADIVAGGEIMELGGFECTAGGDAKAPTWDCPAQKFESKFKDAPVVFFSLAGFARVSFVDGPQSIAIATKGETTSEGFQPTLDGRVGAATTGEKSTISVNWTAVGAGERVHKPKRERRAKQ
jgi:hypothetical protein